ncbi:MAG TPA: hypothetical protein VF803_02350, partial [Candidatus Paceibacterota bacterium]
MKLDDIRLYVDTYRNINELRAGKYARTPLARLLIALAEEKAWSSAYTISGFINFERIGVITIRHPSFPPDDPLRIKSYDWTGWTVGRVEDAVRRHLEDLVGLLRRQMAEL